MDIDGDSYSDFASNGGILISDGARVHCGRITGINSNTVSFLPPDDGR